jgi:uncharacterized membrane protein
MKEDIDDLAKEHLGAAFTDLELDEKNVIESIAESEPIVENVNEIFHDQLTLGQRLADKISAFGGSWTFIIIFLSILISWMIINSFYLVGLNEAFDPYPFILLNLVLSTIAALQAPIIMMSQNRQTAKDRLDITENYKISLKSDLEIMRLHQKIDELTGIISSARPTDNQPQR